MAARERSERLPRIRPPRRSQRDAGPDINAQWVVLIFKILSKYGCLWRLVNVVSVCREFALRAGASVTLDSELTRYGLNGFIYFKLIRPLRRRY